MIDSSFELSENSIHNWFWSWLVSILYSFICGLINLLFILVSAILSFLFDESLKVSIDRPGPVPSSIDIFFHCRSCLFESL
jgi:hypothetical protein